MNKLKIVLLLLVVSFAYQAKAQKIYMYKTFGGVLYMLNDSIELSKTQVGSLLFPHQQAYSELKKARKWSTYSAIAGFTGAAMIVIPITTLALGGNADWGYAAGGAALLTSGFIFNWIYKGRAFYAIDLYNNDLPQKSSRIKPQLQFYGTGAKLVIRF